MVLFDETLTTKMKTTWTPIENEIETGSLIISTIL